MSTAEGNLNFRSTLDDSQFQAAIGRMEVNIGSMTDQITNQNGELETFGKKAADFTNKIFSLENMAEFVKAMVQVRNEYQQLELSFSTILKNKAAADDLMGGLGSFAGKTPFSLKESGDAAKQLLSYGSTTKDVVDELKTLGEVASGASVPLADLAAVYGNMKKAGSASKSDISQLASKGIPIYEELAKVMGVGKERISGLVAAGQVGFPQVEQAFQNLTAAGGTFYGAMEAQSGTLGGQLETLSGAWNAMLNSLGQDGEGFFSGAISTAISLVENYEKVIEVLGELVAVYGVYRAAVMLTSLLQLTAVEVTAGVTRAFKLQYYWTVMVTAVQRVLNATMLSNPYVLTAVAIAGLIAVMYSLANTVSTYEQAQSRLNAASEKAAQDADNLKSKVGGLNAVLQDQNATEFQQSKAYKELQSLYPERLKNLTKEAYLKMSVADAQKMLNEENDKNNVAATGKRYDEARDKVFRLNEELKGYEKTVALAAKKSIFTKGISNKLKEDIRRVKEDLEIANWELKTLGSTFEEQQEAYKVSLMNDAQKLEHYGQQKDRLTEQKDLLLEMTGSSAEMKAQLTGDPFFPLNGHLTEASTKMTEIFNKSGELGLSFSQYSLFTLNKQLDYAGGKIREITEKTIVPNSLGDIDDKIQKQNLLKPSVTNNKELKVIETEIRRLEKQKAKITGKNPNAGKVDTKEDKENRSAAMDSQIAAFSDKFNSTLSDDQQKLKAIEKEYDALNKALIAYNKNPDNVKKKIDLKSAFDLAKKNQEYANETARVKEQLEVQKSMYAAYEIYKSLVGEKAADERFKVELKYHKNYGALLQSKIDEINQTPEDKQTSQQRDRLKEMSSDLEAYRAEQKAKDAASFEQAYNASKTFAQKEQDAKDEYQAQVDALTKDQNGAVTAEQYKNLENIRDASINATKEEAFQKSEIYKKLSEDTLILTREQIKKQMVIMRSLLNDPNLSTSVKTGIQTQLDGLDGRLNFGVNKSNIKELEKRKGVINTNLTDRQSRKDKNDTGNNKEIETLNTELTEVQSKINDLNAGGLKGFMNSLKDNKALQGLSTGLGLASDAASTMSQALGGVDTEAGYTMDTIGQLAGAAGDLAGSIVSGDPAKIVGSAIKAVGTLFSIGKRVREMNEKAKKEVADFYSNAIKGEREYQDSLKERALQRVRDNKTALNGIKDELKIRQDQMAGWKQESEEIMGKLSGMSSIASETYKHGTWFRKAKVVKTYESLEGKDYGQLSQLLSQGKLEGDAKALVERLKELEQKGFDAEKAIADLAKQTNEIFTGTNSDNLTNSLLGMFKDGKTGAQDLADFFKQTMDDAALSIFKNKILAGAMENFYKEFAKRGVSGEELTDTEISELEGIFNNSMANAAKEYEALKKITGRDPSSGGAGPSGLTGASSIKREITEETAGVLTGLWRGQFDLTKQLVTLSMERNAVVNTVGVNAMELLNVARSNFDVALKIESNTYRTANNTDGISGKLDQIIVNTQPSMGTRSLG
ncbi:hypothetical protein DBR43_19905 [Pedobacter sp. KBW06]|uniref:tape measure protein n=1 Tax=Pedobacter sp. KBW06 TaxID=2153359 RepID=UPI000F5B8492|nr:tape measure protein [Pedobacter sp. KBW06]RQO70288.1 hypothetical protein DBR43_19905 [Pedobacter sp. KBW06]